MCDLEPFSEIRSHLNFVKSRLAANESQSGTIISSLFGISAMPVSANSGTVVSSLLVPPATVDGGTSFPILVKKPDTEMDTY